MFILSSRIVTAVAVLVLLLFPSQHISAYAIESGLQRGAAGEAASGLLYAANYGSNEIDIFPAGVLNPSKIGTITQGVDLPIDIAADKKGTLYVANTGHRPGNVAVYLAGSRVPSEILKMPARNAHPDRIGVGPHGTLYVVTNDESTHYFIVEYDPGVTSPSRIVHVPYVTGPCCASVRGIAFDSAENMYLNWGEPEDCCGYGILLYPPRARKPTSYFGFGYGYANGALAVDSNDNIYVGDGSYEAIRVSRLPGHGGYRRNVGAKLTYGGYFTLFEPENYLYAYTSSGIQIFNSQTGGALGGPFAEGSSYSGIAAYPPSY